MSRYLEGVVYVVRGGVVYVNRGGASNPFQKILGGEGDHFHLNMNRTGISLMEAKRRGVAIVSLVLSAVVANSHPPQAAAPTQTAPLRHVATLGFVDPAAREACTGRVSPVDTEVKPVPSGMLAQTQLPPGP